MSKKSFHSTLLGDGYTYHPKVGDRVRFRPWEVIGGKRRPEVPYAFPFGMKHLCGTVATVTDAWGDDITLSEFSAEGDTNWSYSRQMVEPTKMTKAELKRMKKRAEDARIVEEKRKQEEAKAKELRDAAIAALPHPARSFVSYLEGNPYAFGCQREHVVATVGCILGVDLSEVCK